MKQLRTYSNETKQILQKIPDLAKHIVSGVKLTILILKGYKWETTIPEYLALKRGTYNPLGFFENTVLVAQKVRRIYRHGRQGFEITRNQHKRNIYGFYLSEDGVELSNQLIETQVNFCEFNKRLAKEINIKTQKVIRE